MHLHCAWYKHNSEANDFAQSVFGSNSKSHFYRIGWMCTLCTEKQKKKDQSAQTVFYLEGLNSQGYKIHPVTILSWLLFFTRILWYVSKASTFIPPRPHSHLRRQFIIVELQRGIFALVPLLPVRTKLDLLLSRKPSRAESWSHTAQLSGSYEHNWLWMGL